MTRQRFCAKINSSYYYFTFFSLSKIFFRENIWKKIEHKSWKSLSRKNAFSHIKNRSILLGYLIPRIHIPEHFFYNVVLTKRLDEIMIWDACAYPQLSEIMLNTIQPKTFSAIHMAK